jgi:hypothetical protein
MEYLASFIKRLFSRDPDRVYVGDSVYIFIEGNRISCTVLEKSFWYIRVGRFQDNNSNFWYNLENGCEKIKK